MWNKKQLSDVCTIKKGSQVNRTALSHSGDYYVLNGGMEPSGYLDRYNTEANTISISEGGNSCGYVAYNTEPFWSGGHNYTLSELEIEKLYLYYFLKCNESKIMNLRVGSGLPNIQRKMVEAFPVYYPVDIKEQRRIAAVLTAADEAIAASRALVDKFASVKQGLMQDLLGKGEPVKLGAVADNFQYGLNAASTPFDGENKYLRITDIDEETREFSKTDITSPSGKLTDSYLLSDNDIVFARTGASVGKTYIYDSDDGVVYFAGFLVRCRVKPTYCAKYIFYQTLSDDYKRWISINSQRSGQPGINAEQYKKYIFNCPPLPEQERIAKILTAADECLTAERMQLRKLEDIKRGLMNDLLTNRVTTTRLQGGI